MSFTNVQFSAHPKDSHAVAVKQIGRYLKHTTKVWFSTSKVTHSISGLMQVLLEIGMASRCGPFDSKVANGIHPCTWRLSNGMVIEDTKGSVVAIS